MNRDDIIRMAREAGLQLNVYAEAYPAIAAQLARFAKLVAAAEREECATAVERSLLYVDGSHGVTANDWHIVEQVTAHCAAAIRARSGE